MIRTLNFSLMQIALNIQVEFNIHKFTELLTSTCCWTRFYYLKSYFSRLAISLTYLSCELCACDDIQECFPRHKLYNKIAAEPLNKAVKKK